MAMLKVLGLSSVAAAAAAIATATVASTSSSQSTGLWAPIRKAESSEASAHLPSLSLVPASSSIPRPRPRPRLLSMALGSTLSADQTSSDTRVQTEDDVLPNIMTEFMVDMECEGCASSVRKGLESLEGVGRVDVDLPNQVVRVQGNASLKALNEALQESGRKARLIGQGVSDRAYHPATVAEFKGPDIFGVVRIVQVSMELARIEASFSGLSKGYHGWSINEYGDLTQGAASTGPIYGSSSLPSMKKIEPVGDLGVVEVDATGKAEYSGSKAMLAVSDLPGRALVVYGDADKNKPGIAAAVIARSAAVGENYKRLCTCDGTVIWDSTNSNLMKV